MGEIAVVCSIISALAAVRQLNLTPIQTGKRLYRRLFQRQEELPDDHLEMWRQPGIPGVFFKSDRLYY